MSDKPKAGEMSFAHMYSDNSGVEHGVRLMRDSSIIEFEAIDKVQFPIERLNWLIGCLDRIKQEVDGDG